MSTIGAKVQGMPSAVASFAEILAQSSALEGSHVAAIPRGMGICVTYPWITSRPNRSGMCSSEESTANCCSALTFSAPATLSAEPSLPLLTMSLKSKRTSSPVMMSVGIASWLSCPIFCSSVIEDMRSSRKISMSDLHEVTQPDISTAAASDEVHRNMFEVFMSLLYNSLFPRLRSLSASSICFSTVRTDIPN